MANLNLKNIIFSYLCWSGNYLEMVELIPLKKETHNDKSISLELDGSIMRRAFACDFTKTISRERFYDLFEKSPALVKLRSRRGLPKYYELECLGTSDWVVVGEIVIATTIVLAIALTIYKYHSTFRKWFSTKEVNIETTLNSDNISELAQQSEAQVALLPSINSSSKSVKVTMV